jgi:CO dehydrogenase nickel-insertion accessory protein CooC1
VPGIATGHAGCLRGKSGAGKSLIVATFARVLGASGEHVLVLDPDPMPGLAFSLGLDQATVRGRRPS